MTKHNLNDPNQHAFRSKHSTETVFNILTDYILKPYDDGLIAQLLLLDLSSEFDTISHEILFTRLNDVDITGNAFYFIKSYITKRSDSVLIGNEISICACSINGFPQGSILGSLLFPSYINPLKYILKAIPNIKYFVYADDIQLISIFSHNHNMLKNQDLCLCANTISNWLLENNLLLSKIKTELLNISLTEVKFHVVILGDIIIKPSLKV